MVSVPRLGSPDASVRIRCLSTGSVRRKRANHGVRRYVSDDWSDETLPVNVFLIEHSAGVCLFDTGQTARATAPGYFPSWYPFFRLARFELTRDDEVGEQLRRLGHDVTDVRWIVLSHLHTDHVGGLAAFVGTDVLVSRTEWDDAQGLAGRLRGYLPQYWPPSARVRLVDFDEPPIGPFAGTHDVAGDGSLLLVPTPGHTRGHLSLLARDGRQSFLLGGDVAEAADDLDRAAPALADYCKRSGIVFLATHDARASELVAAAAERRN
jgi:glyoxylase-like metal-dependent hydrolase (beta-lactamase superfamily II)